MTTRREVLWHATVLAPLLTTGVAWPQAPAPRTAKVGWLFLTATGMYADLTTRGYVKGLLEGGYVEGRNLIFEKRSADGDVYKLRALARELVAAKVDVIFAPA